MLLKCCTHYASKFGKYSSGHKTRIVQFSFQSLRRAMPKNDQTTIPLCSFHILERLWSKFFKKFFSTWNENVQIYKLSLEKAEETEIKLSTFIESWRKQRNSRKTSTSVSLSVLKPLSVWITTNCRKFLKR